MFLYIIVSNLRNIVSQLVEISPGVGESWRFESFCSDKYNNKMEKIKEFAIAMLFLCTTLCFIMWSWLILYLIGNAFILFLDHMLLNGLTSLTFACINIWLIHLIHNTKIFKLYEGLF